jgi:mono/diheme cytochrome c family protein
MGVIAMNRMMRGLLPFVLVAAGTALGAGTASTAGAGPARAQDREPAVKGLAVARKWCARCHIVEAGQKAHALDAAPPFADLARDPKITAARLRGILSNPHGRMPTEPLTRADIADLIAYIESLRKK